MNIDERIKYLHRVYKIQLINPNIENTNDSMITIKIPQSPIIDKLVEDEIELNDNQNNIRFSTKNGNDSCNENAVDELVSHNRDGEYYYIRIKNFDAQTSIYLYLHIFAKSYSYQEDESIFLYRSQPEDFTVTPSPYYEVNDLSINFLQENPDGSKEVRNPENKTINRDYPEDYYFVKKEYNKDSITDTTEIPSETEPEIYEVGQTTLEVHAKQEFKILLSGYISNNDETALGYDTLDNYVGQKMFLIKGHGSAPAFGGETNLFTLYFTNGNSHYRLWVNLNGAMGFVDNNTNQELISRDMNSGKEFGIGYNDIKQIVSDFNPTITSYTQGMMIDAAKITTAVKDINSQTYAQNNITGEKILYDGMSEFLSVGQDFLRTDLKNIRFYHPESNKLLPHYTIDNQEIKQFIFEIPAELMEEDEINFEILIMSTDYQYVNDETIFKYCHNIKELNAIPQGTIKGNLDTINGESVLYATNWDTGGEFGLEVGAFNYRDVIILDNCTSNRRFMRQFLNKNKAIERDAHDSINFGRDIGYYLIEMYINGINTNGLSLSPVEFDMGPDFMIRRFLQAPNKDTFYPQLSKNNYNITGNWNYGSKGQDDYLMYRPWSSSRFNTSLVISMMNPYQTKGYKIITTIGNFYEFKGAYGYWNTTTLPYQYIFDKDVKSKKLKITFDVELPEEVNENEVTGIALSFNRTKTGNETKKDEILQIIVNDEEGEDKKKLNNYTNNETVIYGGLEDKWELENLSDNMTIDFIYGIAGISKDSTTTVSIGNFNLIIFYKFYDFKDYPAFSRHDNKPYLYKKLEVNNGKVKWVAENYSSDTKNTTPVRSRISTDAFDELDKDKINVHMKHKYNPASSMNTEHLFGFISNDPERKSIVGATIDNLNVLLSDGSQIMNERIINHNIIDKKAKMHTNVHSGPNIDKYYEACLKYLPQKVIMQMRDADTAERTIERESEEE